MKPIAPMQPDAAKTNRTEQPERHSLRDLDVSATASIRSQLEKILHSDAFLHSGRMQRFLRFAVEQTLNGSPDSLKEYSIARAVYDKDEFFDPRLDPIVRIEVGRLRSKLRQYYAEEGIHDPVTIVFPKRSYVPAFKFREDSVLSAQPFHAKGRGSMAIAILPFTELNPGRNQDHFCAGLTEELINLTGRMTELQVVARTSVLSFRDRLPDIRRIGKDLEVDVLLEGSVQRNGEKARISTALVNARNGYRLWTDTYDLKINGSLDIQGRIALRIIDSLNRKLRELPDLSASAL